MTTHDDNAGILPSPRLAPDRFTADSTLRLRGGAASNRPGPAGCCGLGWLFSSTSSRAEGREIDAPSRDAGMKFNWNVHAQRIRDAAVIISGATLWGLLRAHRVPLANTKELDRGVPAAKEKKSFLENSLRARQLMLQGLEDGQLPPSPRYLLTLGVLPRAAVFSLSACACPFAPAAERVFWCLHACGFACYRVVTGRTSTMRACSGVLSGMIWGGVVSEFFSIFFQVSAQNHAHSHLFTYDIGNKVCTSLLNTHAFSCELSESEGESKTESEEGSQSCSAPPSLSVGCALGWTTNRTVPTPCPFNAGIVASPLFSSAAMLTKCLNAY